MGNKEQELGARKRSREQGKGGTRMGEWGKGAVGMGMGGMGMGGMGMGSGSSLGNERYW